MEDKALYTALNEISTEYQSQGHFTNQELQIYNQDGAIRKVVAAEGEEQDPPIYMVDLESRLIETPQWLSVEKDHRAENIYFKIPRYFGATDLGLTNCLVLYENAAGKGGIYPVSGYDNKSLAKENELLFYWPISGTVSQVAGKVKYALMFYQLDNANETVLYQLNTRPSTSQILYGVNEAIGSEYVENTELATLVQKLGALISQVETGYSLNWEDMF